MKLENTHPRSYKLGAAFLVSCFILAIPIIRVLVFAFTAFQPDLSHSTIIEVHKGQSPNDVAKILTTQGIISDGKSFIWLGRLSRQWKKIKAGEYKVSSSMAPIEILSILTSGISVVHPVTVREGENMYEIADSLVEKGLATRDHFLTLCRDPQFILSLGLFKDSLPTTLEGYFFPDTYFFNRTLSDSEMIKQMVRHFFEFWGKTQEERARQLKLTRHEVITLASIVEKETGAPEEREMISSVFHNRLRNKMKLQSDPTTIYGMWERFEGKIHKSDLYEENEYNTYFIPGLPIGPISNPGRDAIKAALNPSDSTFLYFVSHNNGTHQFSRTYEEHNRAVQKFQVDPKARKGKSWRDHLKKPNQANGIGKQ